MANKEINMEETEKKKYSFRGKSMEELKLLDVREFAKFLDSRSRRSMLRGFQEIENFVKNCNEKLEKGKQIKTHNRTIIIVPAMVGMTVGVHNGKEFFPVKIVDEMIGHRLGEFALTRSRVKHGTAGVGATKGTKTIKK